MKVGIIGANSFLARNFQKYIKEVKKIKNCNLLFYDVQNEAIDSSMASSYKQIDFMDKESIKQIDITCNSILMFTGKTGTVVGFEKYDDFIKINEIILLNILDYLKESKSKAKLIYPSTRLVYEGDLGHAATEDDKKRLKSIYAITKYAAEQYIQLYHEIFGIEYCIFRICTPWGSLMQNTGNYGTFNFFIENAKKGMPITVYGDGSVKKTYTCMEDICEILYQGIVHNQLSNDIFNMGGKEKTLQEIANMIATTYNGEVKNIDWPDISKAVDGGSLTMDSKKIDKILNHTYHEITFD